MRGKCTTADDKLQVPDFDTSNIQNFTTFRDCIPKAGPPKAGPLPLVRAGARGAFNSAMAE